MNGAILYIIGTLATWGGWILAFRAVLAAFHLLFQTPGSNRAKLVAQLTQSCVAAAVLLLVGVSIPMQPDPGVAMDPGIRVPLVWALMPFTAWMVVAGIGLAIARTIQAATAITRAEGLKKLREAGIWGLVAIVGFWMHLKGDGEVRVFRGALTLSPATLAILVLLMVGALAAMALAARRTESRGKSKAFVLHAVLITGSIVFGIPFFWLLCTTFKEDKDIISNDGLHLIPRVTQQVKYDDPLAPLYESTYQGTSIQGNIIERLPDGQVKVDVFKPMSIRGSTFITTEDKLKRVPRDAPVVMVPYQGQEVKGFIARELEDGRRQIQILEPENLKGTQFPAARADVREVKHFGLHWQNYPDALDYMPASTHKGLVYLRNTLILVVFSVIGTLVSCTLVAYGFSRLQFPGKNALFLLLLSTMMLPAAVTMLPQFLIFRTFGWIDTLKPLWVPTFFAGAFNVFLLRQFFSTVPMELEDAAKIDGCSYLQTLWRVMVPQIKPALAAIAIWTILGAWNNFMGPLVYISSPDNMPLAYALQLFNGERQGEPGLLMAFATMTMMPVLLLFFFAQRYFIEGVTLSGLGGR